MAATEGSDESLPPRDVPGQVKHYCAAGKASEKAAKGQKNSAMIHAGVAGVCTINCLTSWNPMNGWLCPGAAIAGGVADYALTKEFHGALVSIAGGVGSKLLLGKAATPPPTEAAPAKSGTNWAACATAALEAVNAFMRNSASKKSSEMAKEHFEKAQELNEAMSSPATIAPHAEELAPEPMAPEPAAMAVAPTSATSTLTAGPATTTLSPTTTSLPNTPNSSPILSPPVSFSSLKTTPTSCNSSSFDGVISCAVATSGGALSAELESPRFRRSIEKFLGSSADDLLKMDGPAEVIRRAFDQARLSSNKRQHLEQALEKVEKELNGSTLQNQKKGSFKATGGAETQTGWKQLLASVPGFSGLNSSEQGRREALPEPDRSRLVAIDEATEGLEEDRTVSLFTRVSRRYRESFDALTRQDYSTEQNRLLSK